jgi:DNA polymerase III subunit epsilon
VTVRDSAAASAYRETELPSPGTPWREARFKVLDFETTGLDPGDNEIISFATVAVAEGRVRVGDARYELVRPRRMPDAETIRIHGLREADLAGAPPLPGLLDGLLEEITGVAIVAHVAAVERGFLGAALAESGLELRNPIVDTAALDRELKRLRRDPEAEREPIGLSAMARALGLPVHRPHHADGDALTTAQAFIALATHLEAFGPLTVGSLERISDPGRRGPSPRSLLRRLGLGRRHA